jgi:hypothetical protein
MPDAPARTRVEISSPVSDATEVPDATRTEEPVDARKVTEAGGGLEADAAEPRAERAPTLVDGPHYRSLEAGRPVFYAFPGESSGDKAAANCRSASCQHGLRIVANLHGTCGGPAYACGSWIHAGVEVGALICPTGNAHCGPSPLSPPTWEAPSWGELVHDMDADLERSIGIVSSTRPGSLRREGAILTGYSRGGYAVPFIAGMRPGQWPLLLIIEADATLDPAALRRAKVRAVALVAGEWGDQIPGMRKSAETLAAASFPSRLFVMPKTGHLYSENIEDVMREALRFLVEADSEVDASPDAQVHEGEPSHDRPPPR